MTQPPATPDPLRPVLKEAEQKLADRLAEACETKTVSEETTGELMRLEENLLDAAQAAKQAISIRRRIRTQRGAAASTATVPGRATGALGERRRTGSSTPPTAEPTAPTESAPEEAGAESGTVSAPRDATESGERSAIREFSDARGQQWRVWAVTPGQMSQRTRSEAYMGEYRDGWLAFETFEGTERRRLPHYPPDWDRLGENELEALMQRAEVARGRKNSPPRGNDLTGR